MIIQLNLFDGAQLNELQISIDKQRDIGIGHGNVAVTIVPENLKNLISWRKKSKLSILEYGKDLLRKAFSAFFDQCPEIYAVVWVQYTPYYNDYDHSLTFSVREPEVLPYPDKVESEIIEQIIDDDSQWTGSWPEPEHLMWHYGNWSILNCEKSTSTQKRVKSIWEETIEAAFDEEFEVIMQLMFGESRVVATRDGFNTFEYEHD